METLIATVERNANGIALPADLLASELREGLSRRTHGRALPDRVADVHGMVRGPRLPLPASGARTRGALSHGQC